MSKTLQIFNRIVEFVSVFVMDVMSLWDFTFVIFPDVSVNGLLTKKKIPVTYMKGFTFKKIHSNILGVLAQSYEDIKTRVFYKRGFVIGL